MRKGKRKRWWLWLMMIAVVTMTMVMRVCAQRRVCLWPTHSYYNDHNGERC